MEKRMKIKLLSSLLIAMVMMICMSVSVLANDGVPIGEAEGIKVYMTVSVEGVIAQTTDGEAMAWKEVLVTDRDGNGDYSFDEALIAAHEAFNSPDGYVASDSTVTTLWGKSATNSLFFVNGAAIPNEVSADTIAEGDYLQVSVYADKDHYSDWVTQFDEKRIEVKSGQKVSLNLKGHLGMDFAENLPGATNYVNLAGVQIGTWENGSFKQIGNTVTDADGNATISFDKAGIYVVTAQGTTKGLFVDHGLQMDPDAFDTYGWVKPDDSYDSSYAVGYTETDFGEGLYPEEVSWVDWENYSGEGFYPIEEVKWVDWEVWNNDRESYPNLIWSNQFIGDCPIMAPACIVVVDPIVKVTISDRGVLASARDGSEMVEKNVVVEDINDDNKLTYDEAMVAAHKAYFQEGVSGFAAIDGEVSRLWGVDTTNALFFTNGKSVPLSSAGQAEVRPGDSLYASVNADDVNCCDVKTTFDSTKKTAAADKITVKLSGRVGMDNSNKDVPLANVQLGCWEKGGFKPIKGAVTGNDGKATFTLAPGSYLLTAKGDVKIRNPRNGTDVTTKVMAPYCYLTVKLVPINNAKVSAPAQTYKAKKLIPAVTVKLNGIVLKKGTHYTVSYSNNVKAGTGKFNVTGKGIYTGTVSGTFKINKASQKMRITRKNVAFKKKNLNKAPSKKISSLNLIKVTGTRGKVTYKIKAANQKSRKSLKIVGGTIRVKKGTDKGNYKVTITVKAAGDSNYKPAKKTIKATIKVN